VRPAPAAAEQDSVSRRLVAAEEAQRQRLARDIHDVLGQALTAMKLDIAWLAQHVPDEPAALHARVMALDELASATIHEVRRLCAALRPAVLDDVGLLAAIRWHTDEFKRYSGLRCELVLPAAMVGWNSARCTAAFRVLQESLTNVARHARASAVCVTLGPRGQADAVLEVRDDGCGISEKESHRADAFGLLGMHERAVLEGGTLTVAGLPGRGTTVTLCMPCRPAERRRPNAVFTGIERRRVPHAAPGSAG
jgi:signal transduction histidine kinase